MAKFKVGDEVKILDGSNIDDYFETWSYAKGFCVGSASAIEEVITRGKKTGYRLCIGGKAIFDERGLELVEPELEPKFKPGDKVEILFGDFAGAIDTIKESWFDGVSNTGRWYRLNEKDIMNYKEEELRLVKPEPDAVKHPSHYADHTSLECIEAMELMFGKEYVSAFCLMNAFKYLWRHKFKNGQEDIEKAWQYLIMFQDITSDMALNGGLANGDELLEWANRLSGLVEKYDVKKQSKEA